MRTLLATIANPVLLREARVRMRGWRAPGLIALYVGLLALVVLAFLGLVFHFDEGVFAPEVGGMVFMFLALGQMALLIFSSPGLTAGAISGERERQTLDLLLVTRMSPLQVVLGKLGAALGFTLLLMLASLPVYSVLFLFGGVALYNLALTAIVYVVTVIFLGSIGIYFSAIFKRTQASVVASYGTAFGLILATSVLAVLFFEVLYRRPGEVVPSWAIIFAYLNPGVGLAAAAGGPLGEITGAFSRVLTTPEAQAAIWWKYCLTVLSISAVLVQLTARKIRPYQNK